eukprot:3292181-Pyramimonas_sp.AAC.1
MFCGCILINVLLAIIMDGYSGAKDSIQDAKRNVFHETFNSGLAWATVRASTPDLEQARCM